MTDNDPFDPPIEILPPSDQGKSKKPVWFLYIGIIILSCCVLVGIIAGGAYLFSSQLPAIHTLPGATTIPQDSSDQTQPSMDPTQEAAAQWHLLFSDDFSIDNNRWDTGQIKSNCMQGSRTIEGGKYKYQVQAVDSCVSWEYPDISPVGDFYISVETRQTSGSPSGAYGLVLRNTGSNYYFFLISNNGTFDFERLYAGNFNPFIEWVKSSAIRTDGVNRLSVIARGSHFSLYINDTLVGQIDDDKLIIGSAGIMFSYDTKDELGFEFDNFEIRTAPIESQTGAALSPTDSTVVQSQIEAGARGEILFSSNHGGMYSIYKINADGSSLAKLTNGPGDDFSPVGSPDGQRIAFVSTRDENANIYVMNTDGSGQARLTTDTAEDASPAWSPDGKQIVFVSTRHGSHDIYLMEADGSHQAALTDDPADDASPAWSPDGKLIAFQSNRQSKTYSVFTMKPDGSHILRVTYNPKFNGEPVWSPDGKSLAFVSNRDGNREIYIKGTGTSDQEDITDNTWDDFSPVWSSDGMWLAFVSMRDGKYAIYTMKADGSNLSLLVDMAGDQKTPSWTAK